MLGLLFFLCGFGDTGHAFRCFLLLLSLLFFSRVLVEFLGHFLLLVLHDLLLDHLLLDLFGTFRLLVVLGFLLNLSFYTFRFDGGVFTLFISLSFSFGGLGSLFLIFLSLLLLSFIFPRLSLLSFRFGGRFRVEDLDGDVFTRFFVPIYFVSHLIIESKPLARDLGNVGMGILTEFLETDEESTIGALGVIFRVLGLDALPDRLASFTFFAVAQREHSILDHFVVGFCHLVQFKFKII